jgi:hypothetical protein
MTRILKAKKASFTAVICHFDSEICEASADKRFAEQTGQERRR